MTNALCEDCGKKRKLVSDGRGYFGFMYFEKCDCKKRTERHYSVPIYASEVHK